MALALPGTDVQLMLDANDPDAPVGPLFVVDSVEAFHAARPETLAVLEAPVGDPRRLPGHLPGPGRSNASMSWTSRRTPRPSKAGLIDTQPDFSRVRSLLPTSRLTRAATWTSWRSRNATPHPSDGPV